MLKRIIAFITVVLVLLSLGACGAVSENTKSTDGSESQELLAGTASQETTEGSDPEGEVNGDSETAETTDLVEASESAEPDSQASGSQPTETNTTQPKTSASTSAQSTSTQSASTQHSSSQSTSSQSSSTQSSQSNQSSQSSHVHSWGDWEVHSGDCQHLSYMTTTCKTCNETMKQTLGYGDHSWTRISAVTCTTAGTEKCSVCGETRTVEATGHDWVHHNAETHMEYGEHCSFCNFTFSTEDEFVAHSKETGHGGYYSYDQTIIDKPAYRQCSRCGLIEEYEY